ARGLFSKPAQALSLARVPRAMQRAGDASQNRGTHADSASAIPLAVACRVAAQVPAASARQAVPDAERWALPERRARAAVRARAAARARRTCSAIPAVPAARWAAPAHWAAAVVQRVASGRAVPANRVATVV